MCIFLLKVPSLHMSKIKYNIKFKYFIAIQLFVLIKCHWKYATTLFFTKLGTSYFYELCLQAPVQTLKKTIDYSVFKR